MKLQKLIARMLIIMFLSVATLGVTEVTTIESNAMFDFLEEDNADNTFQPLIDTWQSLVRDIWDAILIVVIGISSIMFIATLVYIALTRNSQKRAENIQQVLIVFAVIFIASNGIYILKMVASAAANSIGS